MRNHFLVLAACTVLLSSGLIHGLWTDRWQTDPAIVAMADKLETVPMAVGSWRGKSLKLDANEMARAGYVGSFWRLYENEQTGAAVSVLMVCGRPGRISVHAPEACYAGSGFTMLDEPTRTVFNPSGLSQAADFWQTRFALKTATTAKKLRICWSWYTGDGWEAAENPRRVFSHLPVLVKLYVVNELPTTEAAGNQDKASAQFMEVFLPELEKHFQGKRD